MNLHFGPFAGMIPRQHFSQRQVGEARFARDVDLRHGTLQPWRDPLEVARVPEGTRTVHQWGCCWYAWDKCVEVAEWLPDCPRLYVTGDQPWPSVEILADDCTVTRQRLGVPTPASGPTAVPFQAPTWTVATEQRSYVYTYSNALGEEGGPSMPGPEFDVDDDTPVTVTGFETPDPEWGVTTINLYRRVSGMATGFEQTEPSQTAFFLVASFPVGTASHVDVVPNMGLGRALGSDDAAPPPVNMRGITAVEGTRILAGFAGNKLHFSEKGQPWIWPEQQILTLDDNILAIRSVGATLYVITDGHPYVVTGDVGLEKTSQRAVQRYPQSLPLVSCCGTRGTVVIPGGVVYVSADGLVVASGGKFSILTDSWYAADDWRRLQPENMRLGYYEATVFAVSDAEGLALRVVGSSAHTIIDNAHLTLISDRPNSFFLGRNGEMFLHTADRVEQWNAGTTWRPYKWISETVLGGSGTAFTVARVSGDSVEFRLEADDKTVYVRQTPGEAAFRLPRYGRHSKHTVIIEGIQHVWAVDLATTRQELSYNSAR